MLILPLAVVPPSLCEIQGRKFNSVFIFSKCSFCRCFQHDQVNCYTRLFNGTVKTQCKDCKLLPSRKCTYCQTPYNRKTRVQANYEIPLNRSKVGDCITCQCTDQGSVRCKYLEATVCRNVFECEKVLRFVPKTNCSYCVGIAPKRFFLGDDLLLSCQCVSQGRFACLYRKKLGTFDFGGRCLGQNCFKITRRNRGWYSNLFFMSMSFLIDLRQIICILR